jgi:hypothetical protein
MKRFYSLLPLPFLFLLFNVGSPAFTATDLNPEFNIEDYDWLVGDWIGDGFGGVSEESWAPAVDGTMMGMYRHHKNGEIVFYEFLLLDETGLRLKHFDPDITSWEEKDDFVTFEMVSFSENMLEMKGLVFEKKSDDEMEIRLKLRNSEGEVRTEVFSMKRK